MFQKKDWKLYLVKPKLSSFDPTRQTGKIVTHRFLIPCAPKQSIIIDTLEQKIIVKVPEAPDEEIYLFPVPEQEDQCKVKIFYDKKNLPAWDRWGKDVAEIGAKFLGNVVSSAIGPQ